LDALVAAPADHQLLRENERVRVIQTLVAAAAMTPVHAHRWPSVEYVLSATNLSAATARETFCSTLEPVHRSAATVGRAVVRAVPAALDRERR
jgi:hypothetical protein